MSLSDEERLIIVNLEICSKFPVSSKVFADT